MAQVDGAVAAGIALVTAVVVKLIDKLYKPRRRATRDESLLAQQEQFAKEQTAFWHQVQAKLVECELGRDEDRKELERIRLELWTVKQEVWRRSTDVDMRGVPPDPMPD